MTRCNNQWRLGAEREPRPTAANATYSLILWLTTVLLAVVLTSCQVDLANPPRLATATAQSAVTPVPPAEPVFLPAPSPTPAPAGALAAGDALGALAGTDLTVWVNEVSDEHESMMRDLAGEFSRQTGANVAVQMIAPALLPDLVNTAVLSGTLPDLVVFPLEYSAGWVERGILDAAAADEVVQSIGPERFDPAALDLVASGDDVATIPLHGYHQLLLYRSDWLEELGLAAPDDYQAMAAAAEATFDREQLITGIIVPTESNLVTTHQAFEHIALANGCDLIDDAGEVRILDDACRAALEHYFTTINRFSPPGVQTDTSARNAFLNGQTAIIMTSPSILPALAGLDPELPAGCPECAADVGYLAGNTGIITGLSGANPNGEPVAFGNITNLGITSVADREAAIEFARFWLEQGYGRWLAVEPERKVPMLLGTPENPRAFIDAWGTQPLSGTSASLADIFGAETVTQLREGIASAPRWGIRQGYGGLVTNLYEELTMSIVLQEMLSGYFPPQATLREAFRRVVTLIPNYAFSAELPPLETPEPTPEP